MSETEKDDKEKQDREPIVFDEQGILLYNLINLTKGRTEKGIENTTYFTDPASAASQYKNFLSPTSEPGLANVCLIDTKTPSTFLNLLKSEPKYDDILLRLSSFELSSLVPTIRIFKVFYNEINNKEFIIEIPFDTVAKNISDGEKSIFESSVGLGSGAGITSVEWKQNPKNEANLSTYKVALNLHLQNVEEFFRDRAVSVGNEDFKVRIEDLLYQRKEWRKETNEGTAVFNPDKYIIKMIVGWQVTDNMLQEIRLNSNRTPADTELLIAALQEQKQVFYLTFVSHSIEFNEDGSIDLQIEYFGRSDMNISDINKSNVLNLGRSYEAKIQGLKKQIATLQKSNSEISTAVDKEKKENDSWFNFGDTDKENQLEAGQESLQELEKELQSVQAASKRRKLNHLVTRMLQKRYIHLFSYDVEMVKLISKLRGKVDLASATDIKNVREYISNDIELKARQKENEQELIKKSIHTGGEGNISPIGQLDFGTMSVEAREKLAKSNPETVNHNLRTPIPCKDNENEIKNETVRVAQVSNSEELTEANEEFYKLILAGELQSGINTGPGRKHFSFFYLSSLIDVLLESVMNTNPKAPNFINKKTRVILGPMSIVDYGSLVSDGRTYKIFDSIEAEKANQPTYVKVFTGKPVTINVGDVPISLKDFTAWFNEYFVNKNKEQVTFNEFISSLMNDLVITSINNQVYPFAPKQKAKFAIDNFTTVVGPKNESAFINNIGNYKFRCNRNGKMNPSAGGFRIAQDALETLKPKSKDLLRDHDPNDENYLPNKDYVVVYCINESPYERTGDYELDKKEGILHLYAGESRGTIRSLKFSRVDNPHRRADNILAETGEGKGVSKLIREKYNVSIEMFGNTSIEAGTYIFVRPTYSTAGGVQNTEKLLRDIGLGGYYMVTEVQSNIDIGDFRTSIKGTWSAFADGKMNDGEREYASPPPGVQPTKGVVK